MKRVLHILSGHKQGPENLFFQESDRRELETDVDYWQWLEMTAQVVRPGHVHMRNERKSGESEEDG